MRLIGNIVETLGLDSDVAPEVLTMIGFGSLFDYYSRRAQQEQVAAINAAGPRASDAHRHLSSLHAMRAWAVAKSDTLVDHDGSVGSDPTTPRSKLPESCR